MNSFQKKDFIIGISFIILAVILGAFGAHGLKGKITPEKIESFETGTKYLMYHGFGFLFLSNIQEKLNENLKQIRIVMLLGISFFSGSIFLLSTQSITGLEFKFLGPITPVGGLMLIISWTLLLIKISKLAIKK